MPPDPRPVYVISVAAELANVHPRTLRVYEHKGLIEPARTQGGTRRYSEADLERLRRINELTEAGLNLTGVRAVLDLEEHVAGLQSELDHERERARDGIAEVERRYRRDLVPLRASLAPWEAAKPVPAASPPTPIRIDRVRADGRARPRLPGRLGDSPIEAPDTTERGDGRPSGLGGVERPAAAKRREAGGGG